MDSAQNGASETTISSGISSHSRNGEGECTDHDASKRRRARPPAQGTAHCIAQRTARRFCTVIVIGNGGNKHCGGTFGGECHRQRTPRKRTAIDIENGTLCGGRGISDHSEPQRADCIQKPESRASAMVWGAEESPPADPPQRTPPPQKQTAYYTAWTAAEQQPRCRSLSKHELRRFGGRRSVDGPRGHGAESAAERAHPNRGSPTDSEPNVSDKLSANQQGPKSSKRRTEVVVITAPHRATTLHFRCDAI